MKTHWIHAGIALALLATLPAQDDGSPAQAPPDRAKERYQQLQEELSQAQRAHMDEVRAAMEKAKATAGAMPAIRMRPDMAPFVPKFQAAAEEFAGTDGAVQFLSWIVFCNDAGMPARDAAFDTLVDDHAASAAMASLARRLANLASIVGEDEVEALRRALRAHNTNPGVLGWLAVDRYGATIDEAEVGSDEYAEAKQQLTAFCGPEYDQALVREIERRINMRERLGIGAVAPDIAGVDLDGEEFRLSDYRGKVIFLDFWGDW